MMPDPPPVWDDERFAGTLFPAARKTPTKWIATDHALIATVEEHRAAVAARSEHRETRRQRTESPDETERHWQRAREAARREMRRERRDERIAAGIEDTPTFTVNIRIDPQVIARIDDAVAASMVPLGQALTRAVEALNDQISNAVAIPQQVIDSVRAVSSIPVDVEHLTRVMHAYVPTAPRAPNPMPSRARYLPNTRHARKGRP